MSGRAKHQAPVEPPGASAGMRSPGRFGRWLAGLGLIYIAMLSGSIGGLVWLTAIYLLQMRHGPALVLGVGTGVGAFDRAYWLAAAASAREQTGPPAP